MASSVKICDHQENASWITMVHGMSQDHRVFDRQVDAFRDQFNLLLIDLPGHGLSSAIAGPYGHEEFARHIEVTIEQNEVEQTHYWGTHTGATVGLLVAARRPELVSALILEGPVVPGNNPPVVKQHMEAARAAIRETGLSAARSVWWSESCWFEHMRSDPAAFRADEHRAIVDSFGGAPWLDDRVPAPVDTSLVGSIAQPTLIYNGVQDHKDFVAAADTIAELIQHAGRAQIDDAGGFPAWEQPAKVNALVASFIGQTPDNSPN